jgi:lipopolysaccharide biosynthesis glycosyltransferase
MKNIRIFIGSDIHNIKAERALIYSILKNTSSPVEFIIMSRFGNDNTWKGWQQTSSWATCFSCYRWAIPAACNFQGKAIYLDSDMITLGNIQEFYDFDASKGMVTTPARESSVMLFDCSKFESLPEFQLETLKASAAHTNSYYKMLVQKGMVSYMPQDWNCLDGDGYEPGKTKLVHYTKLPWQPWHPAPQRFSYVPHPHKEVTAIWHKYYEESFDPAFISNMPLSTHSSPIVSLV